MRKLWGNQNKLWESQERLWENQEKLWRYVRSGFEGVRRALGVSFEEYVASFVEFVLYELGYLNVRVELRKYVLHEGRVIEFNIVCEEPLVVAETTLRLENIERAEVATKVFGKKPFMLVLAVGNAPQEVVERLKRSKEKLSNSHFSLPEHN